MGKHDDVIDRSGVSGRRRIIGKQSAGRISQLDKDSGVDQWNGKGSFAVSHVNWQIVVRPLIVTLQTTSLFSQVKSCHKGTWAEFMFWLEKKINTAVNTFSEDNYQTGVDS